MTANFFGNRSNPSGRINYPANLVITQYSPFNYAVGGGYIESKEDYRFKDFIVNNTGVSTYKVFKYAGMSRKEDASGSSSTYDYRSNTSNWIVYRLSDVLLMKAEAVTQLYAEAGIQEALNLVNQTYLRSNPDADSLKSEYYNGINDIESLVLRERQRELMFEGKRYFDLLRLARRKGNTSDVTSFVSRTSTSTELYGNMSTIDALYWPINEEELIDNPLLEQNPFYENTYPSASK
ncbi:MAG: SusD family protein [Bacteroidetes bacterium ADurb.Bin416]|nr:MAG: SusD family protein [Bacteroidetes bacterium ADurb.Bin416]